MAMPLAAIVSLPCTLYFTLILLLSTRHWCGFRIMYNFPYFPHSLDPDGSQTTRSWTRAPRPSFSKDKTPTPLTKQLPHKSYIVHALNSSFLSVVCSPYLQAGLAERRWLLTLDSWLSTLSITTWIWYRNAAKILVLLIPHPTQTLYSLQTMNHLSNDIPFGINDWYFMNNVPQPIRTFLLLHAMISHNSTWIILSLGNIVPNLFLAP